MDPSVNQGSFMANAGGGQDALKAAMQRRGIDVSVLNQLGGGAVAPQQTSPMPETSAANAAMPQTAGMTAPTAKEPDSDMQIALKALAGVVKNEGQLKQGALQLRGMGGA